MQLSNSFYKNVYPHLNFLDNVSLSANGDETVKLITKTINQYSNSDYIKEIVKILDYGNPTNKEFAKRLFDVCCILIKYRRDPDGHEIIFTPKLLMQVRQGDCKKFATFISCVLKCKGINSATKVVNYEQGRDWQHIYSIMFYPNNQGYITLDPVNYKRYNTEVKYNDARINFYDNTYSKILMPNKLSLMGNVPEETGIMNIDEATNSVISDLEDISGTGRMSKYRSIINPKSMQEIETDYIEGIFSEDEMSGMDDEEGIGAKSKQERKQKRAATKAKIKPLRKKAFKVAKKVGFTPVRAAFLLLIRVGKLLEKTPIKLNLAKKLAQLWAKDGGVQLKALWAKFGGKSDVLKKEIIRASGTNIQGDYIEGVGATDPAVIAAAVTAAAPILIGVTALLIKNGLAKKKEGAKVQEGITEGEEKIVDDLKREANAKGESEEITEEKVKNKTIDLIKKGGALITEALTDDKGGDTTAQNIIKTTPTENDKDTTNEPPVKNETTNASGLNFTTAYGWFAASIKTPLIASTFNDNSVTMVSGIASGVMLFVGLILTVKSFIK